MKRLKMVILVRQDLMSSTQNVGDSYAPSKDTEDTYFVSPSHWSSSLHAE